MLPLLGLALRPLRLALLSPPLDTGFLFLCAVPSTVQSSIALTAMARGNVAAAVCSASLSSLLGAVFTPALVGVMGLASGQGKSSASAVVLPIASQLLVPFIAGQLVRPRIVTWVDRHRTGLRVSTKQRFFWWCTPRSSAATTQGLWHQLPWRALIGLLPAHRPAARVCTAHHLAEQPSLLGSIGKTKSPSCFAARRRAWRAAYPSPMSCFRRRWSEPPCCH